MQHNNLKSYARLIQLHLLVPSIQKKTRIAIPMHDRIEVVDVGDILYLKSDSNYTHIVLINGKEMIASSTLKKFDGFLPHEDFIRVHQSFLVQRKSIIEYQSKKCIVILHNQTKIPVSRSKKAMVMQYLKKFIID